MNDVKRSLPLCCLVFLLFLGAGTLSGQRATIKFGVLPDADSLPFLVADAEGLFAAEGVNVQLTTFQSPVERDAAFQSGSVDGIVGDVLGAAFAADNGFDAGITSLTDGRYGIVASPHSGIQSLLGLSHQPVGTSTNTIIQYFIDTALTRSDVERSAIVYLAVPRMPLRLEMLLNDQLKAAALPEPLLTVAVARGAKLLASSDTIPIAAGVVLFKKTFTGTHLNGLVRFYKAYAKAALTINANNDAYRGFLVQKASFPEEVRKRFVFVTYAQPRLPLKTDVEAVLSWLQTQKLLKNPLAAAPLIDARVLEPNR